MDGKSCSTGEEGHRPTGKADLFGIAIALLIVMAIVYSKEAPLLSFALLSAGVILASGIGVAVGIQIFGSGISSSSVWLAFWISLIASTYAFLATPVWLSIREPITAMIQTVISVIYLVGSIQLIGGE